MRLGSVQRSKEMGGRVGWAEAMEPEEVFFVTFMLSFVSTIVLCGRGRGTYAKERGHAWKKMDLCRDQ